MKIVRVNEQKLLCVNGIYSDFSLVLFVSCLSSYLRALDHQFPLPFFNTQVVIPEICPSFLLHHYFPFLWIVSTKRYEFFHQTFINPFPLISFTKDANDLHLPKPVVHFWSSLFLSSILNCHFQDTHSFLWFFSCPTGHFFSNSFI